MGWKYSKNDYYSSSVWADLKLAFSRDTFQLSDMLAKNNFDARLIRATGGYVILRTGLSLLNIFSAP